jgi:signal peptidase I
MSSESKPKNLKGSWRQALLTFLVPILCILTLRWALLEPFVIPSSSMVPNLLIHDHIFVLKSSMGLRLPFSDHWIAKWREPKRGDILVFKYPENPNVYYIKRLIGLPGDKIEVRHGRISVNGEPWTLTETPTLPEDDQNFVYYIEKSPLESHRVRFMEAPGTDEPETYEVPPEHYFFMGDNRDQSSDGRVWGFVPQKYLIGHAWFIWLSCEETMASASYMCDFSTIRKERFFKKAQ